MRLILVELLAFGPSAVAAQDRPEIQITDPRGDKTYRAAIQRFATRGGRAAELGWTVIHVTDADHALAELDAITVRQDIEPAESAQHIAALLKRTALVAYPRADVAALYGKDWAKFLSESADNDAQIIEAADMLATAAYRPDADPAAMAQPARRWIRRHRA